MPDLLVKPTGTRGKVHAITPESAGWGYVGFTLYRLEPGDVAAEATGDREVILVLVEGKATVHAAGQDWGEMGDRMDVFEKTPPHCLYIPNGSDWRAVATTPCTLAVCTAPGKGGHPAPAPWPRRDHPDPARQGDQHPPCEQHRDGSAGRRRQPPRDRGLHPGRHWSSYPSHRHDEDDFPRMTYLEETYYHRLNPNQGFGIQRVYTEDGTLDETMAVKSHDVVLVPKGHHPCGAPYGYEMYYLNVMAGPIRKWRFQNDPDHDWIASGTPD
jgi:5-deoxy-glucuronate isomerase